MSSTLERPATPVTPTMKGRTPRRWLRSKWLWGLLVILTPVLAWGGYRGLHWFQTRQYQEDCKAARLAEDWRYQRKVAGEWTAWDPAAATGWWFAAEAAQKLDDMEDLADCLGRVPPSDPRAIVALIEKANLEWTVLNRPLAALQTSQRVLAIDPRVLEIQSRVVSYYAMTLQRAPMLKAIRTAMTAHAEPKESYPYLVMADVLTFSNGAQLNSRWLSSAPDEVRYKIAMGVHTAMGFSQSADAEESSEAVELNREAKQQLQWFLDQLPHDTVLLTHLMHRAYRESDVPRMGELLQLVDDTSIDDHMVWVFRCWYHLSFEDFAEAEEAVQEALRLHRLSPLAHHEYAKLLRKMNRPEAEIEREQRLAAAGRDLRTDLLELKSVLDVTPRLLEQIALYAEACGDEEVAAALKRRLEPPPPVVLGTPGL